MDPHNLLSVAEKKERAFAQRLQDAMKKDDPLFDAILDKQLDLCPALIAAGVPVDQEDGFSPLDALVGLSYDPADPRFHQDLALQTQTAELLLQHGDTATTQQLETVVRADQNVGLAEVLVAHGAAPNPRLPFSLCLAAESVDGNPDMHAVLVRAGFSHPIIDAFQSPDVPQRVEEGVTVFLGNSPSEKERVDVLEFLANQAVRLQGKNASEHRSGLESSALRLMEGVDPKRVIDQTKAFNGDAEHGQGTLNTMAECNWAKALESVLAKGDRPHHLALHRALMVKEGELDAFEVLLKHGANPHAVFAKAEGLAHEAVFSSQPEKSFETIQRLGLLLDRPNSDGMTPLFLAAARGREEPRQWLVNHGANLHHKDADGNTLLHHSVHNFDQNQAWIKQLIRAGVDVQAKNRRGQTASDVVYVDSQEKVKGALDAMVKEHRLEEAWKRGPMANPAANGMKGMPAITPKPATPDVGRPRF